MKIKLYLLSGLLLASSYLAAQGCSDAGFCSLEALKSQNTIADTTRLNAISVGIGYGKGFQETHTINPYIEYSRRIGHHYSIQAKLTGMYATGFLGQNTGLGDLFLFGSRVFKMKAQKKLTVVGGVKIPLNQSDKSLNGTVLPYDYQTSIGTYDVILGASFSINNRWEFNTGIQVPVIQEGKNTFFNDYSTDARIAAFASTNKLHRQSDVLLRAGYLFRFPVLGLGLKPNLLAIYHLGKDTYEDRLGTRRDIAGSDGLTLNAGLVTTYTFKNKSQLELVLATPLIVRDVRPDGLTRSAVANIQYRFPF